MLETETPGTPWHLWVVGIVAVLFTSYGCYDYYMSQTANREYIDAVMGPTGIDTDAALQYFANFPIWMDFAWAIGVWGSLAAALLLLFRSRLAFPVFAISIIAFLISNAYGIVNPIPGMSDPTPVYMTVAVVFIILVLLAIYARAMAARGVLR